MKHIFRGRASMQKCELQHLMEIPTTYFQMILQNIDTEGRKQM